MFCNIFLTYLICQIALSPHSLHHLTNLGNKSTFPSYFYLKIFGCFSSFSLCLMCLPISVRPPGNEVFFLSFIFFPTLCLIPRPNSHFMVSFHFSFPSSLLFRIFFYFFIFLYFVHHRTCSIYVISNKYLTIFHVFDFYYFQYINLVMLWFHILFFILPQLTSILSN